MGEPSDHLVLPPRELREVDRGWPEIDAVRRHLARAVDDRGGVEQGLRRDAPDVEAHAPERRVPLDQHRAEPEIGGPERGGIAAGTRAEHHDLRLDVGGLRRRGRDGCRGCGGIGVVAVRAIVAGVGPRRTARGRAGFGRRVVIRVVARSGFDCFGRGRSLVGGHGHERRTLRHRVPDRDQHRFDGAGVRRRHVHRRLVALQGDERCLDFDSVAGGDQHVDDRNVAEVPDVGNRNGNRIGHVANARCPWQCPGGDIRILAVSGSSRMRCCPLRSFRFRYRKLGGVAGIRTQERARLHCYSSSRRTSASSRARCARKRAASAPSTTR